MTNERKPEQYRIAGLKILMTTDDERILQQARAYRAPFEGEPEITIDIPPERIEALKKEYPESEAAEPGVMEYLETGAVFYTGLIDFGGLMLHASAVEMDGLAYLFSAPCGTGKSTHTSLWLKEFGDRAQILNDDKPALRLENGRFYAYGTPWSGKTAQSLNHRVPVAGIALLERGETNRIERTNAPEAVWFLLDETIRPRVPERMDKLLTLVNRIFDTLPIWRFRCRPDADAVRTAYQAMKEEAPQ